MASIKRPAAASSTEAIKKKPAVAGGSANSRKQTPASKKPAGSPALIPFEKLAPTNWPLLDKVSRMFDKLSPKEQQKCRANCNKLRRLGVDTFLSCSELQAILLPRITSEVIGSNCYVHTNLTCESDASRAKNWIINIVQQYVDHPCCCFKEVCDISKPEAACHCHSGPQGTDTNSKLAIGSWDCSDHSKIKRGQEGSIQGNPLEHNGASGTTFHGIMSRLNVKRYVVYIGENCDVVAQVWGEVKQYVIDSFVAIGYGADAMVLDSEDYESGTVRVRAIIVAVECWNLKIDIMEARSIASSMLQTAKKVALGKTGDYRQSLLSSDHPAVQEYLGKLKENRIAELREGAKRLENSTWHDRLNDLAQDKKIAVSGYQAPDHVCASEFYQNLSERLQYNVRVHSATEKDATSIDITPSAGRCYVGKNHRLPTLVPNSITYGLDEDVNRILLAREHMSVHGFPEGVIQHGADKGVKEELYRGIAGMMVVGEVLGAVYLGVMTHWPQHDFKRGSMKKMLSKSASADSIMSILDEGESD